MRQSGKINLRTYGIIKNKQIISLTVNPHCNIATTTHGCQNGTLEINGVLQYPHRKQS